MTNTRNTTQADIAASQDPRPAGRTGTTLARAAVFAAVLAASVTAMAQHQGHGGAQPMGKGQKEMMAMKMTGDPDKDFAMMMIQHHRAGIEMAQIELRDGKDAKMKAMAQRIIDAQKKESAEFEVWLQKNGKGVSK